MLASYSRRILCKPDLIAMMEKLPTPGICRFFEFPEMPQLVSDGPTKTIDLKNTVRYFFTRSDFALD